MRDKVLKIESLIKIRVQEIIKNDGWERKNYFGIQELRLNPVLLNDNQIYIELIWDNVCLGKWRVAEQTIPQLPVIRLKDGSIRNRSPTMVFYVLGSDGRKYRYLYFRSLPNSRFLVGARADLQARYASSCMSRKQRQENPGRRKPLLGKNAFSSHGTSPRQT
jgi:hypothetical protein